jgi:hypothetical protein
MIVPKVSSRKNTLSVRQQLDLALPAIVGNTPPNDYRVNKQLQMMKFNGQCREPFGPILEATGTAGQAYFSRGP